MSLAELLLRLGCTLVAWLLVYTHLLWLATLRVVNCDSDGDSLWRLLLGFAPLALGAGFMLGLSRRLPSVHSILRWAAAPLLLLVPLALLAIWPSFVNATLDGHAICIDSPSPWHPWWAPWQLATVTLLSVQAYYAWRWRPSK